ncbi:MAG: hypothetical protein IPJ74_07625 [Saprospiraceae bacterium]|nr:hypothetical protein [Saprospiraceae bacterium]
MRTFVLFLFLLYGKAFFAQVSDLNKGNGLLFSVGLGAQLPGGDLTDRFGPNLNVGGSLDFITQESNFIFGFNGYYLFGTDIKEDVIAALRTPEGQIIGNDKSYADIQLRERGFYIGGSVGKLFTLSEKNARAGLRVTLGAGLLQHKIRIQDDPFRAVPQLFDDYKKGYDRLTNGLALHQFIGYQVLSTDKHTNFYIGLELTQGFTQNRRDFNFDTQMQDTSKRLDLLFGVKAAWILPFYIGKAASEIYY